MEYIVGDIDNYGSQEDCLTLIIPTGVYELIMEDLRNKFNTQTLVTRVSQICNSWRDEPALSADGHHILYQLYTVLGYGMGVLAAPVDHRPDHPGYSSS